MDLNSYMPGVSVVCNVPVLRWANILAQYALWVMQPYLTNVWGMSFTKAAATINVFTGMVAVFPLTMAFLSNFIGHYRVLKFSYVASSIGFMLLAMSTPPVLAMATRTCSEYEPACIGKVQSALFYTSLCLIAVGMSGHSSSFEPLRKEKEKIKEQIFQDLLIRTRAVEEILREPNTTRSDEEISREPSTTRAEEEILREPNTTRSDEEILREPSTTRAEEEILRDPNTTRSDEEISREPSTTETQQKHRLTICSKCFMWSSYVADVVFWVGVIALPFVKAWVLRFGIPAVLTLIAIFPILISKTYDFRSRYRLPRGVCIRMIPMLMAYIVCGVILSIGNTYFAEQANHMNHKVGHLTVPVQILLFFSDMARLKAAGFLGNTKRKAVGFSGITTGIIFGIFCCITAASVEKRRIGVIRKYGLLDKPDDTIPMTMFWLLPQFILLGWMDGFVRKGIECLFIDQFSDSTETSSVLFTEAIFGAGAIGSVLSIYLSGKVSERGGRPSWFQYTLNKSRLDNYYWTLTVLISISYVVHLFNYASYMDESTT